MLLTLSATLVTIGGIIYAVSILRGRTKPHRTTRFVVFVVLTLNFFSILAAHGNKGAVVYAGIVFVSSIAFLLLSLKAGMGGSSVFDWICLAVALAGVVAWQVADNPILGVYFAILADFVAYLPAFVKTWQHPHTESPWMYTLSGLASFLSLLAYKISAVSAFQFFTIICGLIMLACIYHKKIFAMRLLNQKGFTRTAIVMIVSVLLASVAAAGYYMSNTAHRGTIDAKELGIKLTFSNINGWSYIINPGAYYKTADLEYQGYASERLTRYNAPPSDPNILDQKQIGSYYFGLTRQPCPCNPIGEQAFSKLTSALNSATAD